MFEHVWISVSSTPLMIYIKHVIISMYRYGDTQECRAEKGQDLPPLCKASCTRACKAGLDAYDALNDRETGFKLDQIFAVKMRRACVRQCEGECSKPGKAFAFSIPTKSIF